MTATDEAGTTPTTDDDQPIKPPPLQGGARWGSFGMPLEKSANFTASSRRLLNRLEGRRWGLSAIVGLAIASVCLSVVGPKMLGHATDIVVSGLLHGGPRAIDFNSLHRQLAEVALLYIGSSVLSYSQSYLLTGLVQKTMYRLRSDVEAKLNRLPLSYVDTHARGDLLSRVTNDIDNLSQSLQQTLSQMVTSVFTLLGTLVMMLTISWVLAMVAVITVPISVWTMRVIMKRSRPRFVGQWMRTGQLNGLVEETFTGHNVVKAFGRQPEVEARFREINEEMYRASFGAQFTSSLVQPAMMLIGNINFVAIAVVGGLRVAAGAITIGDVQAFIQYSRQFSQPLTQVASMINMFQSGLASAERIFELLDAEEQVPDQDSGPSGDGASEDGGSATNGSATNGSATKGSATNGSATNGSATNGSATNGRPTNGRPTNGRPTNGRPTNGRPTNGSSGSPAPGKVRGKVEFDHISFSYDPNRPLITDLSLVAEPGNTVAIVGPTGAGKTTLVNLIMRFYELDGGRILLDGRDITTMPRSELRSSIGMVLQDTWLFGGTIRDNLAFGNPAATEEQIREAGRATYVDRFVHSLPDGYDTLVADDETTVSAGEKQLLTIARAFLADPAILILDEATSSVDTRTEVLIQRAMAALRRDRTSFVIAHRLSTIRDADTILVMENGQIVEQGNHEDLLAAGGAYARLYNAQFAAPASELA